MTFSIAHSPFNRRIPSSVEKGGVSPSPEEGCSSSSGGATPPPLAASDTASSPRTTFSTSSDDTDISLAPAGVIVEPLSLSLNGKERTDLGESLLAFIKENRLTLGARMPEGYPSINVSIADLYFRILEEAILEGLSIESDYLSGSMPMQFLKLRLPQVTRNWLDQHPARDLDITITVNSREKVKRFKNIVVRAVGFLYEKHFKEMGQSVEENSIRLSKGFACAFNRFGFEGAKLVGEAWTIHYNQEDYWAIVSFGEVDIRCVYTMRQISLGPNALIIEAPFSGNPSIRTAIKETESLFLNSCTRLRYLIADPDQLGEGSLGRILYYLSSGWLGVHYDRGGDNKDDHVAFAILWNRECASISRLEHAKGILQKWCAVYQLKQSSSQEQISGLLNAVSYLDYCRRRKLIADHPSVGLLIEAIKEKLNELMASVVGQMHPLLEGLVGLFLNGNHEEMLMHGRVLSLCLPRFAICGINFRIAILNTSKIVLIDFPVLGDATRIEKSSSIAFFIEPFESIVEIKDLLQKSEVARRFFNNTIAGFALELRLKEVDRESSISLVWPQLVSITSQQSHFWREYEKDSSLKEVGKFVVLSRLVLLEMASFIESYTREELEAVHEIDAFFLQFFPEIVRLFPDRWLIIFERVFTHSTAVYMQNSELKNHIGFFLNHPALKESSSEDIQLKYSWLCFLYKLSLSHQIPLRVLWAVYLSFEMKKKEATSPSVGQENEFLKEILSYLLSRIEAEGNAELIEGNEGLVWDLLERYELTSLVDLTSGSNRLRQYLFGYQASRWIEQGKVEKVVPLWRGVLALEEVELKFKLAVRVIQYLIDEKKMAQAERYIIDLSKSSASQVLGQIIALYLQGLFDREEFEKIVYFAENNRDLVSSFRRQFNATLASVFIDSDNKTLKRRCMGLISQEADAESSEVMCQALLGSNDISMRDVNYLMSQIPVSVSEMHFPWQMRLSVPLVRHVFFKIDTANAARRIESLLSMDTSLGSASSALEDVSIEVMKAVAAAQLNLALSIYEKVAPEIQAKVVDDLVRVSIEKGDVKALATLCREVSVLEGKILISSLDVQNLIARLDYRLLNPFLAMIHPKNHFGEGVVGELISKIRGSSHHAKAYLGLIGFVRLLSGRYFSDVQVISNQRFSEILSVNLASLAEQIDLFPEEMRRDCIDLIRKFATFDSKFNIKFDSIQDARKLAKCLVSKQNLLAKQLGFILSESLNEVSLAISAIPIALGLSFAQEMVERMAEEEGVGQELYQALFASMRLKDKVNGYLLLEVSVREFLKIGRYTDALLAIEYTEKRLEEKGAHLFHTPVWQLFLSVIRSMLQSPDINVAKCALDAFFVREQAKKWLSFPKEKFACFKLIINSMMERADSIREITLGRANDLLDQVSAFLSEQRTEVAFLYQSIYVLSKAGLKGERLMRLWREVKSMRAVDPVDVDQIDNLRARVMTMVSLTPIESGSASRLEIEDAYDTWNKQGRFLSQEQVISIWFALWNNKMMEKERAVFSSFKDLTEKDREFLRGKIEVVIADLYKQMNFAEVETFIKRCRSQEVLSLEGFKVLSKAYVRELIAKGKFVDAFKFLKEQITVIDSSFETVALEFIEAVFALKNPEFKTLELVFLMLYEIAPVFMERVSAAEKLPSESLGIFKRKSEIVLQAIKLLFSIGTKNSVSFGIRRLIEFVKESEETLAEEPEMLAPVLTALIKVDQVRSKLDLKEWEFIAGIVKEWPVLRWAERGEEQVFQFSLFICRVLSERISQFVEQESQKNEKAKAQIKGAASSSKAAVLACLPETTIALMEFHLSVISSSSHPFENKKEVADIVSACFRAYRGCLAFKACESDVRRVFKVCEAYFKRDPDCFSAVLASFFDEVMTPEKLKAKLTRDRLNFAAWLFERASQAEKNSSILRSATYGLSLITALLNFGQIDDVRAANQIWSSLRDSLDSKKPEFNLMVLREGVVFSLAKACLKFPEMQRQAIEHLLGYLPQNFDGPEKTVIWLLQEIQVLARSNDQQVLELTCRLFAHIQCNTSYSYQDVYLYSLISILDVIAKIDDPKIALDAFMQVYPKLFYYLHSQPVDRLITFKKCSFTVLDAFRAKNTHLKFALALSFLMIDLGLLRPAETQNFESFFLLESAIEILDECKTNDEEGAVGTFLSQLIYITSMHPLLALTKAFVQDLSVLEAGDTIAYELMKVRLMIYFFEIIRHPQSHTLTFEEKTSNSLKRFCTRRHFLKWIKACGNAFAVWNPGAHVLDSSKPVAEKIIRYMERLLLSSQKLFRYPERAAINDENKSESDAFIDLYLQLVDSEEKRTLMGPSHWVMGVKEELQHVLESFYNLRKISKKPQEDQTLIDYQRVILRVMNELMGILVSKTEDLALMLTLIFEKGEIENLTAIARSGFSKDERFEILHAIAIDSSNVSLQSLPS